MLLGLVAVQLCTGATSAREVCRFSGTTDYDGRVAVTSDVSTANGLTRVRVVVAFEGTAMLWFPITYLVEEITTWRGGELGTVAVNNRYIFAGHIVRQQWDAFQRGTDGLQGSRVQAKRLDDFRRSHPGFAEHWDPATFGRPWLQDYPSAAPERRPDLDLAGSPLPSGLRSPLALAFYWVRWLPHAGQEVPVFLPGFKADRLAVVPIAGAPSAGGMLWQAPLRYPALSERPASTATALTTPDGHLVQLAFELHGAHGSARGRISLQGCEGAPVTPTELQR